MRRPFFSLTSVKPRALTVYKDERRDESEFIEGFDTLKMNNYLERSQHFRYNYDINKAESAG